MQNRPITQADITQAHISVALKANLVALFTQENIHLAQAVGDPNNYNAALAELNDLLAEHLSLPEIKNQLNGMGIVTQRLKHNANGGTPLTQQQLTTLSESLFDTIQYHRYADKPRLTAAFTALPPVEKTALINHLHTLGGTEASVDNFFAQPNLAAVLTNVGVTNPNALVTAIQHDSIVQAAEDAIASSNDPVALRAFRTAAAGGQIGNCRNELSALGYDDTVNQALQNGDIVDLTTAVEKKLHTLALRSALIRISSINDKQQLRTLINAALTPGGNQIANFRPALQPHYDDTNHDLKDPDAVPDLSQRATQRLHDLSLRAAQQAIRSNLDPAQLRAFVTAAQAIAANGQTAQHQLTAYRAALQNIYDDTALQGLDNTDFAQNSLIQMAQQQLPAAELTAARSAIQNHANAQNIDALVQAIETADPTTPNYMATIRAALLPIYNDQHQLLQTQDVQTLLKEAKIKQNFFTINNAINALQDPNDAVLAVLSDIIHAGKINNGQINHEAIRKVLNHPQNRLMFGGIDFTGHENDEDLLLNSAAETIVQTAQAKRLALAALRPQQEQDELTIRFALTDMQDHTNATLNAIANIAIPQPLDANYFNSIRQVILANHATLGVANNVALTDGAVHRLHLVAIKTRSKLRRNLIEDIIHSKTQQEANHLTTLISASDSNEIRSLLHQNAQLGNINTDDVNGLTKEDALALRRAGINKHSDLTGRTALKRLEIPAAGTPKHTDLINNIQNNLSDYTYRIVRFEERRRIFRHKGGSNTKEDMNKLYASSISMRDQLVAYQVHLQTNSPQHANLTIVSDNIEKLNDIIKKIDEKYGKDVQSILYFGNESTVVPLAQVPATVGAYLAGNQHPQGGLVGRKGTTDLFAITGHEGDARVNHMQIIGKDNKPVHMVSVQKTENNTYMSEFYFDPAKLDTSRKFMSHIPNDEIMKWAIAEVAAYEAANQYSKLPMRIVGPTMPEECAIAIALYCQYKDGPKDAPHYKDHQYLNLTTHKLPTMDERQYNELHARFEKYKDYLTGAKPELAVSYKERMQQFENTEQKPGTILGR